MVLPSTGEVLPRGGRLAVHGGEVFPRGSTLYREGSGQTIDWHRHGTPPPLLSCHHLYQVIIIELLVWLEISRIVARKIQLARDKNGLEWDYLRFEMHLIRKVSSADAPGCSTHWHCFQPDWIKMVQFASQASPNIKLPKQGFDADLHKKLSH